jgi:hypothetical protein
MPRVPRSALPDFSLDFLMAFDAPAARAAFGQRFFARPARWLSFRQAVR